MMKKSKIEKERIVDLLHRYMNGETSNEDEALLADYFKHEEVDEELQPYKEMFELLAMPEDTPSQEEVDQFFEKNGISKKQKPRIIPMILRWSGVAAAVVLLVLVLKPHRQESAPQIAEAVEVEKNTEEKAFLPKVIVPKDQEMEMKEETAVNKKTYSQTAREASVMEERNNPNRQVSFEEEKELMPSPSPEEEAEMEAERQKLEMELAFVQMEEQFKEVDAVYGEDLEQNEHIVEY